jgi:hypothetical protein
MRRSLLAAGVTLISAACSAGPAGSTSAPGMDASLDAETEASAMDGTPPIEAGAPIDASAPQDASAPADGSTTLEASTALDAAPAIDPGKDADPPCDPSTYPCGPYGFAVGSIAPNLTLEGRVDTNGDGAITSADGVSRVSFASLRAGAGTQALAVIACAVWCGPCNQEAKSIVTLAASYKGAGDHVVFLSDLLDSQQAGLPATFKNLDNWAAAYKVGYPLTIDPTRLLGPFFATPAFPMQMVIRTSDMMITWVDAGADPAALQAQIDAVLANP